MRIEDIWWKRLSNPANLIGSITDSLMENRSVAVVYCDEIPWKGVFSDAIIEEISQYNADMKNSMHSLNDKTFPGDFLMRKYCSEEEQGKYWKPSGTKAKFLAESKMSVLNKSHVFIDLSGNAVEWFRFVDEYTSYFEENQEHGLFVIFTKDRYIKSSKSVDCYYYDENISEFDTLLLCMTILSEQKYTLSEKKYVSETAVEIASGNVVLAGKLAECGDSLVKDTPHTVMTVLKNEGISLKFDSVKIKTALWQAQIKVLFPVLEQYRLGLISKYKDTIKINLCNSPTGTYKTENPYELEIGELYHLCRSYHILQRNEFDMLSQIRDTRNCLAHWDILSFEEIKKILKLCEKN